MKIIELKVENFLRIEAAEINPDGSLVVIAGPNGAGKSSVLNALWAAIGGRAFDAEKPIREGAEKARIDLTLGDGQTTIEVERIYTEGGSRLRVQEVRSLGKAVLSSPQSVLNALVGNLTFDPLAFSRQKPEEQARSLSQLIDLDCSDLDARYAQASEDRLRLGREIKAMGEAPAPGGEPPQRVDTEALGREISAIDETLSEKSNQQMRLQHAKQVIDSTTLTLERLRGEIEKLESERNDQRAIAEQARGLLQAIPTDIEEQRTAALRRLAGANESNRQADTYEAARRLAQRKAAKEEKYQALSERLGLIRKERQEREAAAEYPIEGLALKEGGVLWNGIPFSQASAAERLRVGMAIGMAANPRLRVVRIEDGSLLDAASMAALEETARAEDYQVWIERVADEDAGAGIYIEDGRVRSQPAAADEQVVIPLDAE